MLTCLLIENEVDKLILLRSYLIRFPQIRLLKAYDNWDSAILDVPLMEVVDLLVGNIDVAGISIDKISYFLRPNIRKMVLCSNYSLDHTMLEKIASDYCLEKTFTFIDFSRCLTYLFPEIFQQRLSIPKRDYFFIKNKENKNNTTRVNFKDIIAIESEHNYVRFYTTRGDIMAYLRLSDVKMSLEGHEIFMQIHRCFIISKEYILSIDGMNLMMEGNLYIKVGISYRESFFNYVRLNYITSGSHVIENS